MDAASQRSDAATGAHATAAGATATTGCCCCCCRCLGHTRGRRAGSGCRRRVPVGASRRAWHTRSCCRPQLWSYAQPSLDATRLSASHDVFPCRHWHATRCRPCNLHGSRGRGRCRPPERHAHDPYVLQCCCCRGAFSLTRSGSALPPELHTTQQLHHKCQRSFLVGSTS